MAHTKTATLETNDLTQFDGSTGTGLTVTAGSKYSGTYGLNLAISDLTARYVYWNSLGNVLSSVSDFMFDPNSATVPYFMPICEVLNNNGDGIFRVYAMKSVGQTTYTLALATHQYTRQSSYALGSERDTWVMSKWYYNMTDTYHKIRLDCRLAPSNARTFEPLYKGECSLLVDDVLIGSMTEESGQVSLTRRADGGMVTIRYGVCAVPGTGTTGTLFFDEFGWSKTYSDILIPAKFHTVSDNFLFRASGKEGENWCDPPIIERSVGSTGTFDILFDDSRSITSATVQAYLNSDTSAIFATSACTVSENIITTPSMSGLVGNNKYIVELTLILEGRTVIRRFMIQSVRSGDISAGIFVDPPEYYLIEGSSDRLMIVFSDVASITAATTATKAYQSNIDKTTTLFPAGSSTASNNALITPTMTGLTLNNKYVLEFTSTIDSRTVVRKLVVYSLKHGGAL